MHNFSTHVRKTYHVKKKKSVLLAVITAIGTKLFKIVVYFRLIPSAWCPVDDEIRRYLSSYVRHVESL